MTFFQKRLCIKFTWPPRFAFERDDGWTLIVGVIYIDWWPDVLGD